MFAGSRMMARLARAFSGGHVLFKLSGYLRTELPGPRIIR
jgi:hypothetical protein